MFLRLVQFGLILTLCSLSSGFSCRWINRKFWQYHGKCLSMLREMEAGIAGDGGDTTVFDTDWQEWFIHHTRSKVWLVIQTLDEVSLLLSEAYSASWSEKRLDDFLSALDHQAEELRSCVTVRMRKNNRLSMFFRLLRDQTQNNTADPVSRWEKARKVVLKLLSLLESLPVLSANYYSHQSH